MKNQAARFVPDEDAIGQYKRDGFFIARGLLPAAAVENMLCDIHRLATRQLLHFGLPCSAGNTMDDIHRDLQALFKQDLKTYLNTLTLASKLTSLYQLFLHPKICDAIAGLGLTVPVWQTGPLFHIMSKALRVPGGYYGFGMHQDWPSQQGGLDGVTVWVPLADVDRRMFTMQVIPGSHKQGVYPTTQDQNHLEIDPASYNAADMIPIEAHRGDVVFMSAFTLHRSCPEGDDRLRVSASIRYENATEPHFIARGYPGAQKRSAMKELITPGFPSTMQLQEVFD